MDWSRLDETVRARARRDLRGHLSSPFVVILLAVFAAVGALVATSISYTGLGWLDVAIGALAGALCIVVATFAWSFFRAPVLQRDEARERVRDLESVPRDVRDAIEGLDELILSHFESSPRDAFLRCFDEILPAVFSERDVIRALYRIRRHDLEGAGIEVVAMKMGGEGTRFTQELVKLGLVKPVGDNLRSRPDDSPELDVAWGLHLVAGKTVFAVSWAELARLVRRQLRHD